MEHLHTELIDSLKSKGDERLDYLLLANRIACNAGKVIKKAFYEPKSVMTKSCTSDLVTQSDQQVERQTLDEIRKAYPNHRFIGEESVAAGESCELTDDPTWIIDPIDGTVNFVHRLPFIAISIGFAVKKKIEVGLIYNPILNDCYYSVRSEGAYHNNKRLHVSDVNDLSQSLLLSEWGSNRNLEHIIKKAETMKKEVADPTKPSHGLRSFGSCALNMCFVASGSADGYFEWGIHCWDMAAGLLIIEEAGGVVKSANGEEFDLMARSLVAASTPELAKQIAERVVHIELPRD